MSAARLTVTISLTDAQRAILAADTALRTSLAPVLEAAAMDTVQTHLDTHYVGKPNKLGGASTGYWTSVRNSAAATTEASANRIATTVKLTGVGLRMKMTGGIIKPSGRTSSVTGKPITRLAIPVTAAAHGKVPAMFGDLVRKGGGLFSKTPTGEAGTLLFILARQAKIKADPNILPPIATVRTDARAAVKLLLN